MSQRHGRFWSIGYNAIGYTGDIKKPNWFTNVRRFAGLSTAGNAADPQLSAFYYGQGASPINRWVSSYFNKSRSPSRCYMWSGSRYPYNSNKSFKYTTEFTQVQRATIKVGYIGTGRASHRDGENSKTAGYINLRWRWDNQPWQETRVYTTPLTYVSDWYGSRTFNFNHPTGRGTIQFEILGNYGDFDQHDVGDRGPNASWSPVVNMALPGAGHLAAYNGELFKSFSGHQTRQYSENN